MKQTQAHGGARPGAGRKRGGKNQSTLTKEAAREALRQVVFAHMERMTSAQIQHACGVYYMVLRKPDGTYARATDEKQIDAAVAAGSLAFQIFTQAPNTQAYTDLMNRALDKPAEQVQEVKLTGSVELLARLDAGRKRAAGQS